MNIQKISTVSAETVDRIIAADNPIVMICFSLIFLCPPHVMYVLTGAEYTRYIVHI